MMTATMYQQELWQHHIRKIWILDRTKQASYLKDGLLQRSLHELLKGLTNTETEVHDIYMPNKARKSIPQLRRVPSHKLEITA